MNERLDEQERRKDRKERKKNLKRERVSDRMGGQGR